MRGLAAFGQDPEPLWDMTKTAEKLMRAVLYAFALCVMASPVVAQDRESRERGYALALQLCSGCHVVAPGQRPPTGVAAPTFRDIANRPGMNEVTLHNFLRTPHPIMPMLILSAEEMRDVSSFIIGLKAQ